MTSQRLNTILDGVAARARGAGAFASVSVEGSRLVCAAQGAEAEYRLDIEPGGALWVSVVTPNRWLSESIETELLHTGDKIEELLEDELIDQGYDAGPLKVEHYRSVDLLFTFRSRVPEGADASGLAATCLLAYEACFRQLGDMAGGDGED
ncbi:MAG: hypothetical protein IT431_06895 [Phycisphaerales bacterium]|nr:hypothetical protein [Phycisphaerales bacterium]